MTPYKKKAAAHLWWPVKNHNVIATTLLEGSINARGGL